MRQEIKNRYFNGEVAIICRNNEEAMKFVTEMGEDNLRYSTNQNMIIPFSKDRIEPAVYSYSYGSSGWTDVDSDYLRRKDFEVIAFDETNKEEEFKMEKGVKDRFYNREIAIVCKNNREAQDFVRDMKISNLRYSLEPDFIIPFFGRHEPAAYWFTDKGDKPGWSSVDFAMEYGRKIVEYSDIEKEEDIMEMKIKVKTFGELLGTEGVELAYKSLCHEGKSIISNKMLDFCGKEITFNESQIGKYGDDKIVYSDSGCWHKWMCSEWFNDDEVEKLEDEFDDLECGIDLYNDAIDTEITIKLNDTTFLGFNRGERPIWIQIDSLAGIALTFDQCDEIIEYINKVKGFKQKVEDFELDKKTLETLK